MPVGKNLEIVVIRQITVSHLKSVYINEIFILKIPGILLTHSRYFRPVREQAVTLQPAQTLGIAVEYRNTRVIHDHKVTAHLRIPGIDTANQITRSGFTVLDNGKLRKIIGLSPACGVVYKPKK